MLPSVSLLFAISLAVINANTIKHLPCHLTKHPSVEFLCQSKNVSEPATECGDLVDDNTFVEPKCRSNYYAHDLLFHMRCESGRWDYVARCRPECGTVVAQRATGDQPAKLGEIPWHAGIYIKSNNDNDYHCGGSLVSSTVVISAISLAVINANTIKHLPCHLTKHPSVEFLCQSKNVSEPATECGDLVDDNTFVEPKCRSNYYAHDLLFHMRCESGRWDYVARCRPECGTVVAQRATGDQPAKLGEIPWHAGIYIKSNNDNDYHCGGSLVSSTVVISAASCFWVNYRQLEASNYAVAVGKLYADWDDSRDEYAQKSDVRKVKLPREYVGFERSFLDNIALVFVSGSFELGAYVRPVCLDFDIKFERSQLTDGKRGKIASRARPLYLGSNQDEGRSQVLQTVELPFVERQRCINESQKSFLKFFESESTDKFCAYHNETASLCEGDNGGGLSLPASIGGVQRYFLRGVLFNRAMDVNGYVTFNLFTQISKHECFISQNIYDV